MTRRGKRAKHIGFQGLSRKIAANYRKRGFSSSRARYIGKATAGKVAREKGKR